MKKKINANFRVDFKLLGFVIFCGLAFLTNCKNNGTPTPVEAAPLNSPKLKTNDVVCTTYTEHQYYVRNNHIEYFDNSITVCHEESSVAPPSSGTAGSTNPNTWSSSDTFYSSVSGSTISSISTYLSVFNSSSSASITIYVNEPIAGSDLAWTSSGPFVVGDAFIKITQGSNVRVLGFYPSGGVTPMVSTTATGVFLNRSGAQFSVAGTFGVSATNFAQILDYLTNFSTYKGGYDFNSNNTIDVAYDVATIGGLVIYAPQTYFPSGYARAASFVGSALRYTNSYTTILDDAGGYASTNSTP